MKALAIRKVDARLATALARETRRRGTSLNRTADDLAEFEANLAVFDKIDPELWR
jgi:hypothetical protein